MARRSLSEQILALEACQRALLAVERPRELEPALVFDPYPVVRTRSGGIRQPTGRLPATPAISAPDDPAEMSVSEAAGSIRTGQLSPVELVRACLRRIATLDPHVGAWVTVLADEALVAARKAESEIRAGRHKGMLHGIPFGVKDIIYTRGVTTTGGSRASTDFVPNYDATVVRRLKQAGAIMLGKTTTTEFASAAYAAEYPPTSSRNPWNLGHTPGGSSMGSAVAVAARMVPFAIGTQTGGSILRPAAFCGIVGVKPTYGQVSRYGVIPASWTMDHVGPMARSALDASLVLEVMAGRDRNDQSTRQARRHRYGEDLAAGAAGLRVGIPDRYFFEKTRADVLDRCAEALRVCTSLGITTSHVTMPPTLESVNPARIIISAAESATYHRESLESFADKYGSRLRVKLEAGQTVSADAYLQATRVRSRFVKALNQTFSTIDILVTPTCPTTAPLGLDETGDPQFNAVFSFAGFPSLTIPVGFDNDGLPIGWQLAGAPGREADILRLAHAYQQVTDWHLRIPAL